MRSPAVDTKDDVGPTDIVETRHLNGSAVQAYNSYKWGVHFGLGTSFFATMESTR